MTKRNFLSVRPRLRNGNRRGFRNRPTRKPTVRRVRLEPLEDRRLLAGMTWYVDALNGGGGSEDGTAANPFDTIQEGVAAADASGGDTVLVGDGTYNENVSINKNLTLLSVNGRGSTTIEGVSGVGSLGSVVVTNNTSGVQIGAPGQGFTIVGIDNGSPGIENAALYFQGSHSDAQVLDNEIVAAGDHGLLTEYGATIDNFVIDGNEFSGQTFVGANPAGNGFGQQFTLPNVPRQLVVMGGGSGGGNTSNISFLNNQVTGTAGGTTTSGNPQGNTLVTIDADGATISGNTFAGTTSRFATSLRSRGPNTTITGNNFDSSGLLTDANGHVYAQNTGQSLSQVAAANTFDKGVYVDGPVGTIGLVIAPLASSAPNGTVVHVLAGAYDEGTISVNNSVTLRGPNAGVDPQGARGPEALIQDTEIRIASDGVTIDGFQFTGNAGFGATISQNTSQSTDDAVIQYNLFTDIGRWAVYHVYGGATAPVSENWLVDHNFVDGWTGNDGTGLLFWNMKDVTVSNNRVRNLNPGVTGNRGIGIDSVENALVTGNVVSDLDRWGMQLADSFFVQRNTTFSNNQISDVQVGIQLVGLGQGIEDVWVQQNQVTDVDAIGLWVTRGSNGTSSFSNVNISENVIQQDVGLLLADFGLIDVRLDDDAAPHGSVTVADNDVTFQGSFTAAAAAHAIKLRGSLSTVTVSGNTLDGGNVGDAAGVPPTSGIYVQTDDSTYGSVPGSADIDITANEITGFVNGLTSYDPLNQTAGAPLSITDNDITGNSGDGLRISGGTALIEGNDLRNNGGAGLVVEGGAIVDAGQTAPAVDFTGLGISGGLNNFFSYQPGSGVAIRNLNSNPPNDNAGPQGVPYDLTARNNFFHGAGSGDIEAVVEHDVDNSSLGFVDFSQPVPVYFDNGDLTVAPGDTGDYIVLRTTNSGDILARVGSTFYGPFDVTGSLVVSAGAGDDYVVVSSSVAVPVEVHGGPGNDYIAGSQQNDMLFGDEGDDRILAGGGDDFLDGGVGNDRLDGGEGNDVLLGGDGRDLLTDRFGDNYLDGGAGDDQMAGGVGLDVLVGGAGNDTMNGYTNADILVGGDGDDRMYGHYGDDVLLGGDGRDYLRGDFDKDVLAANLTSYDGTAATDAASAAANDAALRAILADWQMGNFNTGDLLGDDADADLLLGGSDADRFYVIDPPDRVYDFNPGDGDTIN